MWGTQPHLAALFGAGVDVAAIKKRFVFRYRSADHWLDVFANYYGPVHKAFGALTPPLQEKLAAEIRALLDDVNIARDGTLVAPSDYLEVVAMKRRD
jgi:hypothetical protein